MLVIFGLTNMRQSNGFHLKLKVLPLNQCKQQDQFRLRQNCPLLHALCATSMKDFLKFSTIVGLLSFLILLLFVVIFVYTELSGGTASLRLVNSTGQHIESAQISLAGETCSVMNLGVGGQFQCSFGNLEEGSYSVSVKLQDGSIYNNSNLGYVTSGMDFDDIITIQSTGQFDFARAGT